MNKKLKAVLLTTFIGIGVLLIVIGLSGVFDSGNNISSKETDTLEDHFDSQCIAKGFEGSELKNDGADNYYVVCYIDNQDEEEPGSKSYSFLQEVTP